MDLNVLQRTERKTSGSFHQLMSSNQVVLMAGTLTTVAATPHLLLGSARSAGGPPHSLTLLGW